LQELKRGPVKNPHCAVAPQATNRRLVEAS
jgi:hypothetical protein